MRQFRHFKGIRKPIGGGSLTSNIKQLEKAFVKQVSFGKADHTNLSADAIKKKFSI